MSGDYIRRYDALNFEMDIEADPDEIQAITKGMALMSEYIKGLPTADVVEVVRCKDCIQHVPDSCFCRMADRTTRDEEFCSWGVKRRKNESLH